MNHSINFFRFVFTIIVAFSHCVVLSRWMSAGNIVVEFFFILSGYFLYHHCINHAEGVIAYTKKRFHKFWLKAVLVSLILNLFNYKYLFSFNINEIIRHFTEETLLLYEIIPINDVIDISNNPVWYLSVLLYGGAIIYAIIKGFPKQHKIIVSLLAFVCYVIIFNKSVYIQQEWTYPNPFLRGVAGISTGCLMYILINEYKNIVSGKLINLLSITAVVVSTLMLFYQGIHGIIPIICYCFIIWACFTKESILYKLLNKSIFSKLSTTSFEIFIGHMLFMKFTFPIVKLVINKNDLSVLTTGETIVGCTIYIIVLLIAGFILQKTCNYIQKYLDRIFI